MKDYILCETIQTEIPFYAGAEQVPVCSLEELCCYMQGHLFLVDEAFFEERLFAWIQQDLELPGLASSLQDLKHAESEAGPMIRKVFEASGLYDREELAALADSMHSLQNKSALERQMIHADYLLGKKAYREALAVYLDLQKEGRFLQMSEEMQKRVCYHLGVIYARFLLFPEAEAQFLEVWEHYGDPKGREALLLLQALSEQEAVSYEPSEQAKAVRGDDQDEAANLLAEHTDHLQTTQAQHLAKEALSGKVRKSDWIRMLLKKYEL